MLRVFRFLICAYNLHLQSLQEIISNLKGILECLDVACTSLKAAAVIDSLADFLLQLARISPPSIECVASETLTKYRNRIDVSAMDVDGCQYNSLKGTPDADLRKPRTSVSVKLWKRIVRVSTGG